MSRPCLLALGIGMLAAAGELGVATTPVRLRPAAPGWERCITGTGATGTLQGTANLVVPGADRQDSLVLEVQAQAPAGRAVRVGVTAEGGTTEWQALGAEPLRWALPVSDTRGVLLRLSASEDAVVQLQSIILRPTTRRPWSAAVPLLLAVSGLTLALARTLAVDQAVALGLVAAGFSVLAAAPLVLFWTLPQPAALMRIALPVLLVAAGVARGLRSAEARRFGFGVALLAAAVFGAWVRVYFLPAAGSWDTDYWKACMRRVATHGVTRAYGDPGWPSPDRLLKQLSGEEPLWEAESFGKTFVVDQPPGIMAAWGASWWLAKLSSGGRITTEVENGAAKLPPVAGDLLAVGVLLWAFRERSSLGLGLAALYWALPVSWLSSAVLGFFDGAYVPLALAALVAAGRGRSGSAGALLALAALVKSTALLVAPAVLVALLAARVSPRRAVAWGLGVVAAALVPFLLDGTLATAFVHCYRIIFQKRLSGGFANGWWILGHLLAVAQGRVALAGPVPFVHIENVPFPVSALGAGLFGLVTLGLARLQLRAPGPFAATLVGAVLIVSYAMLAIGVHENHPHLLVLAFLGTGLPSRRLRWLSVSFLATYLLDMLALSGLGRFYGPRYQALTPVLNAAAAFRMLPGFDVTLLLAVVNLVAYAVLLSSMRAELSSRP